MTKHTFVLNLRRESPNEQWGFSLVGGSDQGAPLIVTKVAFGSPASSTLQKGDIITKIGNYDARDVRHQDAQTLFKNSGTGIKVVVQRDTSSRHNTSTASSRASSHTPMSISPNLSPRGPQSFNSPGNTGFQHQTSYTPAPALQPYLPTTPTLSNTPTQHMYDYPVMTDGYFKEYIPGQKTNKRIYEDDIEHVVNQPYRTTPLVLPGAKVKHESGITESYLRHHPNPSVRSSPHHIDHEHLMKQRVADSVIQRVVNENPTNKQIVHKQFNSPIGMYSEPNIVDTIKHQAGLAPQLSVNGTAAAPQAKSISKKFDPSLSETYKALQEEQIGDHVQEVTVPVQPKVFTPNKVIPGKKPLPYNQPVQTYVNSPQPYGNALGSGEVIQQSGSFKRLMYHVMAESNF